jgi:Na+/melibiose symporter-like transporter
MIRKTVIQTLTTATVVAVCAGISLVAAAFGLFVMLRSLCGEVMAYAIVAGVFALVALVVAFVASRPAPVPKRPVQTAPEPSPILASLMAIVRDKPLVSAAVAAAAGIIAVRNPQMISSLIAAFLVDTDPKD